MEYLQPLAVLALVNLMGAMSPGPTFLVVVRASLLSGRMHGLMAALGCAVGTLPWAFGAVAGLAALFKAAPWLYAGMKVVGGAYLIYLAVMIWRGADTPLAARIEGEPQTLFQAFWQTMFSQLANPKVAVFFGSIFVAVIPADPPTWVILAILAIVLFNELMWYTVVAVVFSSARPRAAYLRFKPILDRLIASLLGALGVRLILDARS